MKYLSQTQIEKEEVISNGQYRDARKIGHKTQSEDKQNQKQNTEKEKTK